MWRSLVAHTLGVRGVAGSNPAIPTTLRLDQHGEWCRQNLSAPTMGESSLQ